MYMYLHYMYMYVLRTHVHIAVGFSFSTNCSLPLAPEDDVSLVSEIPEDGVYEVGDVIVWECDDGLGHLWQTCKSNSEFSRPNKDCSGAFSPGY